jgi:hypothetical protein
MYDFCTYFDVNYLPRGLALYESLREHCPPFRLWILCLDDACCQALARQNLPYVELIPLAALELADPELAAVKPTRSRVEYYFTCTPALAWYILNQAPGVEMVTYLDADLFFFSTPMPVFDEIADASVAIIGHRLSPYLRQLEAHGIYNVGWVSFRRDESGLACLRWWRERCLEWCYDRVEDERFADQKYLNDWPTRFDRVVVLQHKGANLALWNVSNYNLTWNGQRISVDGQPLIFFHFHELKRVRSWLYNLNLSRYRVKPTAMVRRRIYAPYLRRLGCLERVAPKFNYAPITRGPAGLLHAAKSALVGNYMVALDSWIC